VIVRHLWAGDQPEMCAELEKALRDVPPADVVSISVTPYTQGSGYVAFIVTASTREQGPAAAGQNHAPEDDAR
jgi:hypothetical protein